MKFTPWFTMIMVSSTVLVALISVGHSSGDSSSSIYGIEPSSKPIAPGFGQSEQQLKVLSKRFGLSWPARRPRRYHHRRRLNRANRHGLERAFLFPFQKLQDLAFYVKRGLNRKSMYFNRRVRGIDDYFRPADKVILNEIVYTSGTKEPQATGVDQRFPDDCGRSLKTGKGLLCFPDAVLCQKRTSQPGVTQYNGRNYLFSFESDQRISSTTWDWFNARNYCRKRCMDLVSLETPEEYDFVKQHLQSRPDIKHIWTSGRLCDFDGCDKPEFQPKSINGWFWSANQVRLSPTNSATQFHDWSFTGRGGGAQPDNFFGGEACLAVMNNFYQDGIKWHDVNCKHKKHIVCEDNEGHLNFVRSRFPFVRP